MTKRKKRALARKKTASKRGKARTKAKSAPRKAKRIAVKAKAKKHATKARAKRAVPKKAAPRPAELSIQPAEALDETVIVDIIEEPVPGVMVVTEFETERISRLEKPTFQPEGGEGSGIAKREEEER